MAFTHCCLGNQLGKVGQQIYEEVGNKINLSSSQEAFRVESGGIDLQEIPWVAEKKVILEPCKGIHTK